MNRIVPSDKKGSVLLEMFHGTLMSGGQEVEFTIKTESSEYCIQIETAEVEKNKSRWKKEIDFEIGFTWAGPLAFVINIGDPQRMRSQSGGLIQLNTIDGSAYRESPSGFSAQEPLPERPRVMNPYVRQHSRSDDNLSRASEAMLWRPDLLQNMQPLPGTTRQPFPRAPMPRTPEAAFNLSRDQLLFPRSPSAYPPLQHEEAEYHDGWPTIGRQYRHKNTGPRF